VRRFPVARRLIDLTPMDFSFSEFVKDNVYPKIDFQGLRDRIVNTVALKDVTSLNKLYYELQHRLDVCRITRGRHTNPLKLTIILIIFKNSVRTSKRTPHFTITKIS
jgi:hypothetical protein